VEQQFDEADVRAGLGVEEVAYLGTGNFGETWRAYFGGRDAACKIIHHEGSDNARLEREIIGYRRVSSKYVVELYDVATVHIAEKKRAMLVFEYIAGGNLRELLNVRRPDEDELRGLAHGILCGLQALHGADLLHRDLKPANIALRDGRFNAPVILDLGLAKLLDVESITRYPQIIGTPLYMAPEQLRGERALRASDLWALGTVLYEALTGRHPFVAEGERLTLDEALVRMTSAPQLSDSAPPDLVELISRCLSDPPYHRGRVANAIKTLQEDTDCV
jgi:serine/threonine protein kinase